MNAAVYVGIDVANRKLDACFLDARLRPVRAAGTWANEPDGWKELAEAVVEAGRRGGEGARVVVGVESTSNMHTRVAMLLREEKRVETEVHVLNPRAVKNFAKAKLKDCKTDKGDARLIAEFVLRMQPEPRQATTLGMELMKETTRTRRRLVEERTKHKNRLHKLLRFHFPGYRKVIGKGLGTRIVAVLAAAPSPADVLALSVEQLSAIKSGRNRIGVPFAEKVLELAAGAPTLTLPAATRLVIRTTAARVLDLHHHIAELDTAITALLHEHFPDQVLTSIPGLGDVSAAAILAEVGDITRFKRKEEFVGYCGLYPVVWESGDAKRKYRMTTKGNRMLKMTLMVASAAARQFNPIIKAFYARLRKRQKTKMAAGGAISRKLAEVVFTLLVRNERWDGEKATRGIGKAEAMAAAWKEGAEAACATD